MNTKQRGLVILILVISVIISGCGSGRLIGPTITPTPTLTMTPTVTPTITPTMTPTPVPLPDPSGVIKENGFTLYLGDFRCADPYPCKAYTKPGTGLFLWVLGDGSAFKLILSKDPRLSIALVKKVLSALYPDFTNEIVSAIPSKGTSGEVISGHGSNKNYNWTMICVWGIYIEVNIGPLGRGNASALSSPTADATQTPSFATKNGIPIIQSVNLRKDTSSGELKIYQDISFTDNEGDVTHVDYKIISATVSGLQVEGGTIDIPSTAQKSGAVISGEWGCGNENYSVTLRVTLTDNAGNISKPFNYTMVCEAGN
jgi:hypothetical protein